MARPAFFDIFFLFSMASLLYVMSVLFAMGWGQLVFNNPEFTCTRPKTFIHTCESVSEIEKPLFYTCHMGETRDRLIDLEVC